jgi:hypothetical protein
MKNERNVVCDLAMKKKVLFLLLLMLDRLVPSVTGIIIFRAGKRVDVTKQDPSYI